MKSKNTGWYLSIFLLTLFCSLLFPSIAFTQVNKDSLLSVWNNNKLHDSIRLEAIKKLAWEGYANTNPDSAIILSDLQFEYAKQKGLEKYMASSLSTQGLCYYYKGDYLNAIEKHQSSLRIKEKINDKKGISNSYNNLAMLFAELGNYTESINYLSKALKIREELDDKNGVASTLNNIGNLNAYIYHYDKALEYYEKSLAIYQEINDEIGISNAFINIAGVYMAKRAYEKALENYSKALLIKEKLNDDNGKSSILLNMGKVHSSQREFEIGNDLYNKSLTIAKSLGSKSLETEIYIQLGYNYFEVRDLKKAVQFTQLGLEMAKISGNIREIKEAAGFLFKIHKQDNNFPKALEMHELFIQMRDSIEKDENKSALMHQQFQYDFDKREALLAAEQDKKDALAFAEIRRKNLQRNASISGFGLMLLLAIIFFTQRNRISKEKDKSENLLLNILPYETAQELKAKGSADAKLIDHVTVLFTDFKGFTAMAESMSPKELVNDLNICFSEFDRIMEKHGIEKIKTIGDSYMAAGGLPTPNDTHASDVVKAAFEITQFIEEGKQRKLALGMPYFEIRIGIHTGPVVAGIVGIKKFSYDIWGDTVNTASRMESSGEIGKVNISETTYQLVKNEFQCEYRGEVEAKGKGMVKMYFVG